MAQLKRIKKFHLIILLLVYPFLLRSGPIETQIALPATGALPTLSISAKKWPNWNQNLRQSFAGTKRFYPFLLRSGPIETLTQWFWQSRNISYPFLLRSGPIETPHQTLREERLSRLSISAKKWPNWNMARFWYGLPTSNPLSISAKKWPNWNAIIKPCGTNCGLSLSISAKKWPNWNLPGSFPTRTSM